MIKNKLSNTGVCNRWTGRSLSQCMVCNPEAHEVCRLVITSGGHRVVCRTLSGSEKAPRFLGVDGRKNVMSNDRHPQWSVVMAHGSIKKENVVTPRSMIDCFVRVRNGNSYNGT